jgi:hypothetical protein
MTSRNMLTPHCSDMFISHSITLAVHGHHLQNVSVVYQNLAMISEGTEQHVCINFATGLRR